MEEIRALFVPSILEGMFSGFLLLLPCILIAIGIRKIYNTISDIFSR